MNGKKPTKAEAKWIESIVEYGCVVCRNEGQHTPPAVHHINGSRKIGAHFETIPLCYLHHQGGEDCERYTSRHPFKARFEERYGTDLELLAQIREELAAQF